MTTAAKHIIQQAQVILQDVEGVRWPATELIDALNDGQRAVVEARPDATSATREVTLVAGHRQALDPDASCLIEVTHNVGGRGRAVRQAVRNTLDVVEPEWTTARPRTEVIHFCYDPRTPREFIVYPPQEAGVKVVAVVAKMPTDVPPPSGATASTVTGDIGVPDNFANALLHFVLFRAFAKDAESGGNESQSMAHFNAYGVAIGTQLQSSATVAPQTQTQT